MSEDVTHIIMLEMTQVGVFNGVSRCIQTLSDSLSKNKRMKVTWLRVVYGCGVQEQLCHAPISFDTYRIPVKLGVFLADASERKACWDEILRLFFSEFHNDTKVILHVHTLNLIELANHLKKKVAGKIVTHLHCIPWKSLYDRNYRRYHALYHRYYVLKKTDPVNDFVYRQYEKLAYQQSDAIICVTQNARDFLLRIGIPKEKLYIVYNGLPDIASPKVNHSILRGRQPILLYVGNSNPSKGLDFLLQALSDFEEGAVRLIVVGNFPFQKRKSILSSYPQIDIQFTGQLSLEKMVYYYSIANIGIIPSIHEQCSYTALEMMMFGLPVICTEVDGLSELFRHGVNAIKVPLLTPPKGRQKVDSHAMYMAIRTIICQPSLHKKLSEGCRNSYLQHFTEEQMLSSVEHIYSSLNH